MSALKYNSALSLLVLLLLLMLGLYWEVASALFNSWLRDGNPTYSHGWLLLLVSIYLVNERWRELPLAPRLSPSWLGGCLVALSSIVWLLATLGSIQVVQFIALVGLVGALFWGVMGLSQARMFIFPILLMLGTLPLWDWIAALLQLPTTLAAEWMLRLSMVPVLREGFFLSVPAGDFEVEAACSGLHYILVAAILGLIFGAMHRLRWWVTAIIALCAVVIAIVANFIRVYTVILIGQYTDMESNLVEDHASVGWVIFTIGVLPLFWAATKYATKDKCVAKLGIVSVKNQSRVAQMIGVSTLFVGLLVGPLWMAVLNNQSVDIEYAMEELPAIVRMAVPDAAQIDYQPAFMAGDLTKAGWVTVEGDEKSSFYIYMSRFFSQSQGKEAVGYGNRLVARESLWRQLESDVITLPDLADVTVNAATLSSGESKLRVWQWYQVGDKQMANSFLVKVYNVINALQGNRVVDVIVLAIEVDGDVASADSLLHSLFKQL